MAERKRQHNSAATEAQSIVVADTEDTTEKQPAVGMSKDDAEFVQDDLPCHFGRQLALPDLALALRPPE